MPLLFLLLLLVFFFPYANDRKRSRFPFATAAIIALNGGLFALDQWGQFHGYGDMFETLGFVPGHSAWYTLFTASFVHANLPHLFFNMWFLYLIGGQVEERMSSALFVPFYLAGGAAASIGHWILAAIIGVPVGLLGASGSVYAVMGAYLVLHPFEDFRFWYFFPFMLRMGTFRLATIFFVTYKVAVDLFWAWAQVRFGFSNVGHWAHLGGFAFGFGVAMAAFGAYAFTGLAPPSAEERRRERLARKVARRKMYSDAVLPQPMSEKEVVLATDDMTPEEGVRRGIFFHNGRLLDWGYYELLIQNPRACLEPKTHLDMIELLCVHGRDGLAEVACWNLVEAHPGAPESIQARFILARMLASKPEMRKEAARLLKEFLAAGPSYRDYFEAEKLLKKIEERPLWQWKS